KGSRLAAGARRQDLVPRAGVERLSHRPPPSGRTDARGHEWIADSGAKMACHRDLLHGHKIRQRPHIVRITPRLSASEVRLTRVVDGRRARSKNVPNSLKIPTANVEQVRIVVRS